MQIPHGAATVSGESTLECWSGRLGQPPLWKRGPGSASRHGPHGKTRTIGVDPQVRISRHRALHSSAFARRVIARHALGGDPARTTPGTFHGPRVLLAVLLVLGLASSAAAETHPRPRRRSAPATARPRSGPARARRRGHRHRFDHADGQFGPVTLPPGDYDLIVAAAGLRAAPRPVTVTAGGDVDDRCCDGRRGGVGIGRRGGSADRSPALARHRQRHGRSTASDLEARQTDTATDALRLVPGFNVATSGGRGAITSLFPRGGESDYTLVIVDGIPHEHLRRRLRRGASRRRRASSASRWCAGRRARSSAAAPSAASCNWSRAAAVRRRGQRSRAAARATRASRAALRDRAGRGRAGGGFERLPPTATRASRLNRRAGEQRRLRAARSDRPAAGGRPRHTARARGHRDRPQRTRHSRAVRLRSARTLRRSRHGVARDQRHERRRGFRARSAMPDACSTACRPPGRRTRPVRQPLRPVARPDAPDHGPLPGRRSSRRRGGLCRRLGDSARAARTTPTSRERCFEPVPVDAPRRPACSRKRGCRRARAAPSPRRRAARAHRTERARGRSDPYGPRPAFDADVVWSFNPKFSAAWSLRGPARLTDATGWTKVRMGAGTGIKPPTAFEIAFTDNPSLKPERSRSVDAGIEQVFPGATRRRRCHVVPQSLRRSDRRRRHVRSPAPAGTARTTSPTRARRASSWACGGSRDSASPPAPRTPGSTPKSSAVDNAHDAAPSPFTVGDPLDPPPRRIRARSKSRYVHARAQPLHADERPERDDRPRTQLRASPSSPAPVSGRHHGRLRSASVAVVEVYGRVTNLFDRALRRRVRISRASAARRRWASVLLSADNLRFAYDAAHPPRTGRSAHGRSTMSRWRSPPAASSACSGPMDRARRRC